MGIISMNSSKLSSFILIGLGAAIAVIAALWTLSLQGVDSAARVLGIGIGMLLGLPMVGIGLYLFNKGRSETAEDATIAKQRKLLNLVLTKGQVQLREASLELNATRDEVRELVKDLVGKQLFSGYVDWDAGTLFSVDAAKLKDGKCPRCGGALELAGKGLVKCPYCGAEVFLS